MIPPYRADKPFEFVVRAIYSVDTQKYPNHAQDMMLFHWKYLYEKTGQRAGVGTFSLKIANASQAAAIAKEVDATFENSDRQTKTETEAQFVASFIALIGDLGLILNAVAMAVAFTILLVTANTMSMAIRERRKEIAVLKTLGFPSALVLLLVLGEALVIGLLGSGLGVLMAMSLIGNLGAIPGLQGFGSVAMSAGPAAAMFAVGSAMGLISGLAPAVGAYRANITSMLRQV
jgi:putative ABC transport system permease protein